MTTETLTPLEERKRTLPFGEPEKARLEKLDGKLTSDAPFSVAVCGHFSAGKSTLLNHLLGADLLPSSPIPTTANIMTIAFGDPGLEAITNDGETHVFTGHIPWEKLHAFALDGTGIREVKLSLPLPFLPAGVTLADTPGVDSTDGTHESYTGTELLTTDAIIYMTDYNHVRSETNLRFLRQMQRENKPIVLVVNQIDKHDDNELPFSIFSHGLKDMLQRFDIHPIAIYFTSGHQLDHPENELTNWIGDIRSLLYHATSLKERSKTRMVRSAVSALLERLYEDRARGEQAIEGSLQAHGFSVGDHQTLVQIRERLKRLDEETRASIADMRHRLDEFFKQTYLFPHDLMESTKAWLESLDPSFKVGMLGSKKKKAAEQDKREEALTLALKRRWETEVHLYISEYFKKLPLSPSMARHAEAAVQAIPFRAGEAGWLRSFVADGVKNDQYVYTLASRLNHALLKEVKDTAWPLYREIVADFEQQAEDERSQLLEKSEAFQAIETLEAENADHLKAIDDSIKRVKASLEEVEGDEHLEADMKALLQRTTDLDGLHADIEVSEQTEPVPKKTNAFPQFSQEAIVQPQVDWQALKRAAEKYMNQPYAEDERKDLLTTIEKAEKNDYTFVMAGAFSAGKSTFLNALVQEEIMPVSPHPTTASLTVVRYPDERHQHAEVSVEIKSEAVLDAEIQAVAYECGYTFNLTRLKKAEGLSITKTNTLAEKQRLEYLRALQLAVKKEQYGYGKTYDMSLRDWQAIAAKEDHACLIEESTVYFRSAITAKGWSLVDTPGVQSVNERHTRLAVEKIKKADRFMYLTYYHHAFSRADQAFIKRIKEIQAPHYMVINAADLAKDEQEEQYVTSFVNEQLKQAGCRESITVPLSSKQALAPAGDQRFSDFMHYLVTEEGTRLQVKSHREINKQLHTLIDALNTVANIGKQPLEERKRLAEQEEWTYNENEWANLKNVDADDGEIKVWEGHATRRLLLVFADHFSASVHVASVNAQDKSTREKQLHQALDVFLTKCEEEWEKEQQALERQVRTSLTEQITRILGEELLEDIYVRIETEIDSHLPIQSLQTLVKQRKLKKSFFYDGEFDTFKSDVFSLLEGRVRERVQVAAETVRKGKNEQLAKIKAHVQKEMKIKEEKQAARLHFLTSEHPDMALVDEELETLRKNAEIAGFAY